MFERFTEHARHVMSLENRVAQGFHHEYLGTEHLLLGLLREKEGIAAQALSNLGLDRKTVRAEIEKLVEAGPETQLTEELHQTPRLKHVIQLAIEEARQLGHNQVGTEHLLLGLFKETDGVAAHALENLKVDQEKVRGEMARLLDERHKAENAA